MESPVTPEVATKKEAPAPKPASLKSFLLASKPDSVIPAHVSIMCLILTAPNQKAEFFINKCGLHDGAAVRRALKNLQMIGWVAKDGENQYRAVLDKLPKGE
ncbi:MAG: hypothetical protein ABSD89_11375 [Halobacteriota archaeon]|jgi:hypothetical protein